MSWSEGRIYDGLFADAGTGKSRMILRRAQIDHSKGLIDAVVVYSINSVKTNFVAWDHMLDDGECDAVTEHLGDDDVVKGVWCASPTAQDKKAWAKFEDEIERTDKLIVLVVNFDALRSEQFFAFLQAFMKRFRCRCAADESTRIGEPGSQTTKRALKLAPLAKLRTCASATPALKRPTKIFAQAKWLSPDALGFKSFYSFRNRYCVMGGYKGKQITDYQHLDELADKIADWSFRVKIEDVHEMPPRDWKKHYVKMSPEQGQAYRTMREEFFANIRGEEVTANIVLAQMTRLQQILGGYVKKDDVDIEIIPPERNPKVQETYDIIENSRGQCLVWFRFRPELDAMARYLDKKGVTFYEFHGDYTDREKVVIRKSFKRGDRQVLLGTAASGGIGIDEFKVASDAIFFSNDFDTERRYQTERRNWRIGVVDPVRYHDILIPNTVDTKIIKVLRGDSQLSAKLMREAWKEWV